MKKKIIYAIIALVIVAGSICAYTMKFRFNILYEDSIRLDINIGKQGNVSEVKEIAKEVFTGQEIAVQEVEIFQDMFSITVREVNDDQKNQLIQKINEKYGTELEVSSIAEVVLPHYRARDLFQRYILPILIVAFLILIYVGIRYQKLGIFKIVGKTLMIPLIVELVYLSILAIGRIPISFYTLPLGITIAIITLTILMCEYEKKLDRKKEEKKIEEKEVE